MSVKQGLTTVLPLRAVLLELINHLLLLIINCYYLLFFIIHPILESHELVSWMRGDDSSIHSISVHASGRYALTSSNSVAQLWDLDTFSRKRTLNGAQTVGIQQVRAYLYMYH